VKSNARPPKMRCELVHIVDPLPSQVSSLSVGVVKSSHGADV